MRVAINGFGRIGRNFLRAAKGANVAEELRKAVNGCRRDRRELDRRDLGRYPLGDQRCGHPLRSMISGMCTANANLLRYDTVHGRYPGTIEVVDGDMVVDGDTFKVFAERDPAQLHGANSASM